MVAALQYPIILGKDLLKAHKVSVDFATQQLHFPGTGIASVKVSSVPKCANIHTSEAVVIPPMSEMIVPVHIPLMLRNQTLLLESKTHLHRYDLAGAACVISKEGYIMGIKIMNPNDHKVSLKKNAKLLRQDQLILLTLNMNLR